MIELNYGVPGSGKTFKGVHFLHSIFIDEKSPNYQKFTHFYTNIADFKFDKFNGLGEPFKINEIKKTLGILRLEYLKGIPEADLIAHATALGFANALFVIDEAQNFFSKSDDLLLWWIEYHRHFSQYIILIAQSPKRILSGYKDLGDLHYKAVPPSLRLGSSLSYKRFAEPNLYKASYIETLKLSADPDIFALYQSGANEKPKKVIYKFIGIGILLAVLVTFAFNFFATHLSPDNNESSPTSSPSSPTYKAPSVSGDTVSVACFAFDCSYMGSVVPIAVINQYEHDYKFNPISINQMSPDVFIRVYPHNAEFIKGVFNVSINHSSSS